MDFDDSAMVQADRTPRQIHGLKHKITQTLATEVLFKLDLSVIYEHFGILLTSGRGETFWTVGRFTRSHEQDAGSFMTGK